MPVMLVPRKRVRVYLPEGPSQRLGLRDQKMDVYVEELGDGLPHSAGVLIENPAALCSAVGPDFGQRKRRSAVGYAGEQEDTAELGMSLRRMHLGWHRAPDSGYDDRPDLLYLGKTLRRMHTGWHQDDAAKIMGLTSASGLLGALVYPAVGGRLEDVQGEMTALFMQYMTKWQLAKSMPTLLSIRQRFKAYSKRGIPWGSPEVRALEDELAALVGPVSAPDEARFRSLALEQYGLLASAGLGVGAFHHYGSAGAADPITTTSPFWGGFWSGIYQQPVPMPVSPPPTVPVAPVPIPVAPPGAGRRERRRARQAARSSSGMVWLGRVQ